MAVAKVHGPGGQLVHINLKCRMCRVLSSLRHGILHSPQEGGLDLADTEGNLKRIDEHLEDQAYQYLDNNGVYVLCAYSNAPGGDTKRKYRCLVEDIEAKFPDFDLDGERREAQKRSSSQASNTSGGSSSGSSGWAKVHRKSREAKAILGATAGLRSKTPSKKTKA